MNPIDRKKLANRFDTDEEVSQAMRDAVHKALADHKRKSNSIAVWKNGKVVIVPSAEIPVEEKEIPAKKNEK